MDGLSSPTFSQLATLVAAIGALGAAAAGLVDTSKLFWGGMSNAGFGFIKRALIPFRAALDAAVGGGDSDDDESADRRTWWDQPFWSRQIFLYRHMLRAIWPFGRRKAQWEQMLKAHWLNGRPKNEQKAIATSLIRVGLSPKTASKLATALGPAVNGDVLISAAIAIADGAALSEAQVNGPGSLQRIG